MRLFDKYFHSDYKSLMIKTKNIDTIIEKNRFIIVGDFHGIQKFIFDRLATKNAAKILRAKSAYIQIFTEYIAKYICHRLEISQESILSINAGKFEILSDKCDDSVLKEIQKKIDSFFIQNFYGLSGVSICKIKSSKEDFIEKDRYRILRANIADELEKTKFKKFNLQNQESLLSYETNINNNTLCKTCNIRKSTKIHCNICEIFIELGKKLSNEDTDKYISSEKLGIRFDDFIIDIELSKKIKSYILYDGRAPADFKFLADKSCNTLETGIKSLGILKADVDNMGKFLENSDITDCFENFDMFSKTMDNFFSLYIPDLMKDKYPHTYTIFAGGDDIFLVGAWDEILKLAQEIHNEFKIFTKNKLSISFGIAIAKPSTPISFLAEHSEMLLENAKEIDADKDAISLFKETVKWEDYLKVLDLNKELEKIDDINTAFTYRLLELIEMSKKVKYADSIQDTIWKSKLAYSFQRNMDKRYLPLLNTLNEMIEKYPRESKMVLSEFIYKRRK